MADNGKTGYYFVFINLRWFNLENPVIAEKILC
jgi:hypothetical protein